jgi:RND family efflux transporter MFP subunit
MSRRVVHLAGIAILSIAFLCVLFFHVRRSVAESRDHAARVQNVALGPVVLVKKVLPGTGVRHLSFPGEARPFLSTTLYAKLPGYLREIRTDKGQRVKQGEILAIVSSPETQQDVTAAETDLALRRRLASRADALSQTGVMSRQDREVADAQMRSSQSALRRTRAIQGYQVIQAPFSGTVTARYADPGALISAATGSTQAAQPIVDIAQTDKLRITIYVGQDSAASMNVGDNVTISTGDHPGRKLPAHISLTSGELEPKTRTMLVEIWFDNTDARILPGAFVHVDLDVREPSIPTVPNAAIIIRAGHVLAGVVDGTKVHLVPVAVGASDGNRTQVISGLAPGQLVANDFPAELPDGATIQPFVVQ